ncbi:MAG: AAA family ATPase [bacterium]|nr:AAA family ATPase [bacterium]
MKTPTLYIFSGLPASGKSTLAKKLTSHINAAYLRIDTLEQGIRDLCDYKVTGEGYRLAYRIATDNIKLGISVIADSCNPIKLTRDEWNDIAIKTGSAFINIEVICSDMKEHQNRVETRANEIKKLVLPTWTEVLNREYHEWTKERIVIDTSNISESEAFDLLISKLNNFKT